MAKIKVKKRIPFDFILEELSGLDVYTKPMFGCTGVYVGEKIVLILRQKLPNDLDNGVWLATMPEHHESLRDLFPHMKSLSLFGPGETAWQNLPEKSPSFEEDVIKACELIRKKDIRIGKVPKRKKTKAKKPRG